MSVCVRVFVCEVLVHMPHKRLLPWMLLISLIIVATTVARSPPLNRPAGATAFKDEFYQSFNLHGFNIC